MQDYRTSSFSLFRCSTCPTASWTPIGLRLPSRNESKAVDNGFRSFNASVRCMPRSVGEHERLYRRRVRYLTESNATSRKGPTLHTQCGKNTGSVTVYPGLPRKGRCRTRPTNVGSEFFEQRSLSRGKRKYVPSSRWDHSVLHLLSGVCFCSRDGTATSTDLQAWQINNGSLTRAPTCRLTQSSNRCFDKASPRRDTRFNEVCNEESERTPSGRRILGGAEVGSRSILASEGTMPLVREPIERGGPKRTSQFSLVYSLFAFLPFPDV